MGKQNAFETHYGSQLRGLPCGLQSHVWKGTVGTPAAEAWWRVQESLGHSVLTIVARKSKSLIYG